MAPARSLFPSLPDAPRAAVRPRETTVHGRTLSDPYAWLKDPNWREVLKDPAALDPEIAAHLKAENAYAEAGLAGTADLRTRLVAEMRGRIREDDAGVPEPDGPFAYYTRHRQGGQHPLVCRRPRNLSVVTGMPVEAASDGGSDLSEEILVDGDREGEGLPFFELSAAVHSDDHARLAWAADTKGSELHTIRVRDLASGADLEDRVENTSGEAVWNADATAFWYVALDANHRPARVMRHVVGESQDRDATVYEEADAGYFVHIGTTQSRDYLTITASDHETSEVRLIDRREPGAEPVLIQPRTPLLIYSVENWGPHLFILTNAGGAEDFKIVSTRLEAPGLETWTDVVPYRQGVMIRHLHVIGRHIVRLEIEDARPRIVVRDTTGTDHAVAFAEEAYSLSLHPGHEFETSLIRFTYSSMTTPAETYDYDCVTRARQLRKRQEVPSGHDPAAYVTRRLFATAPDGEQVPISLLHRRDTPVDGTAPLLLYGYGSYGTLMPANFRTNLLSLVDRGFVYAIAHVRGGTEKGWRWYLDGKREKKPNTFTDFIACGHALAEAGYTAPGRIVAHGGSAGGMLMGAVANRAPELFAGIVADVPFVDVMNTMLDAELPLTPPEWPEWGNPAESEAAFETILAYSPYDTVSAQDYPAILALGGLTDPRVTYWEPAKWVAKLRATMTGGGPVLMRINMEAGHGGAAGRFDRLEEVALIYAFALLAVGRAEGTGAA
ncbi:MULTISPECIES: S9 family peptidase [Methylobacterium]|uniref:Dipeptidyl aminopeptidase BI n=3 Tax=Pseudomonadota TaxID=1224 RepID=A0ABQ4T1G1_9HYPH|nr:MAG: S9 family peptidase [Methylobacterium sp. CG09_land_8_20_14_0_10_71_15]PIU13949.1 MAG: S9 family peptidase [Methylobacterium sp. CG08_land_8_20_14_0_20_71_15]GJE07716.1 Dipeptidyl aminopeptidase BI [Methylobacterium jeotgali]